MRVAKKTVIQLSYTLTVENKLVQQTPKGETQTLLIGHAHTLPPGLEAALIGLEPGTHTLTLPPNQGYGVYDPAKRQTVSRNDFPPGATLEPGESFYAADEAGNTLSYRVVSLAGDLVTVDANPEHAGQTLHYGVTIHKVRAAEAGELEHGHVHGEGGVHHHGEGHERL